MRPTAKRIAAQLGIDTVIALPIAAGVFEPALGLVQRPEIAALYMSGSRLIVAGQRADAQAATPAHTSAPAAHETATPA